MIASYIKFFKNYYDVIENLSDKDKGKMYSYIFSLFFNSHSIEDLESAISNIEEEIGSNKKMKIVFVSLKPFFVAQIKGFLTKTESKKIKTESKLNENETVLNENEPKTVQKSFKTEPKTFQNKIVTDTKSDDKPLDPWQAPTQAPWQAPTEHKEIRNKNNKEIRIIKKEEIRKELTQEENNFSSFVPENEFSGVEEVKENLITPKTQKEKETSAKEKEKQKRAKCFTACKDLFLQGYKHIKGVEYYFTAQDAGNLTKLISKIDFQIRQLKQNKDSPTSLEEITATFQAYCNKAYKADSWINDNFSLSILNSKFNEIFNVVINGKAKGNENGIRTRQQTNDGGRKLAEELFASTTGAEDFSEFL